jgi:predicted glycosyltransferase
MPNALGRPLRIALYSHDTMGLGHARRNGLIASALAGAPLEAEVLLITGTREAGTFPLPRGVDCVTLPAYRKDQNGGYSARSLIRETESLTRFRARLIEVALAQFVPDVFIVDNVPRGALNELDPVLHELRRSGRTRTVLGLRDVLDAPDTVRRQWDALANEAVIERCLDAVWVYGDRRVNDVGEAYGLAAATRARLRHIGYLDQAWRLAAAPAVSTPPGAVLCCVGGGQDGALLARTFLEAELPPGRTGLILTGPFMPAEARLALERRAAERPGFAVLPFVTEPIGHIARAERVITMGGYNTVNELLSLARPGLLVPRVQPRQEQLIRAERLAALGLVDWLHPDHLDARTLTTWLHRPPTATADPRQLLDFGALERLPGLIADLVGQPRANGTASRAARLATCLEDARHGIDPRAA